jgi:hypothetical protein
MKKIPVVTAAVIGFGGDGICHDERWRRNGRPAEAGRYDVRYGRDDETDKRDESWVR